MKNVFLFPGQGAQKKGMLLDICQKYPVAMKVVKEAEDITGEKIREYLWETEDQELARSDRSQLAITTASLALVEVLKETGVEADICSGFSLGEFAALCTAGVLSFEDTIKLVQKRGKIMQRTCDALAAASCGREPGMAAVIGLGPEQVMEAIEPLSQKGIAFAANLNSPRQTVISGTAEGIEKAEMLCTAAGCRRFIKLKVAGPFHSPLMEEAGKTFAEALETVEFHNPVKTIFSNVTGKEIKSGKEAKELAVMHFTNPVRWTSEEAEIARLLDYTDSECQSKWNIFEAGPGTVLAGLWRDSGFAENISCKSAASI